MKIRIVTSELTLLRWLERVSIVVLSVSSVLIIARIVLLPAGELASRETVPAERPSNPRQSLPFTPISKHDSPADPSPADSANPVRGTVEPASWDSREEASTAPESSVPSVQSPAAQVAHLRGKDGLVVMASDEADAAELLRYPEKLSVIIQRGALFGVPNGTGVAIEETRSGLLHVRVVDGKMAGTLGWIAANNIVQEPAPQLAVRK